MFPIDEPAVVAHSATLQRNQDVLDALRKQLTQRGLKPWAVDNALACELRIGGVVTGTAYFVSAAFVFTLDQHPLSEDRSSSTSPREFDRELRHFQDALLCEAFNDRATRGELYLFVVGSDDYLTYECEMGRRSLLENDTNYARKYVVTTAQALELLKSPFASRETDADALAVKLKPTFSGVSERIGFRKLLPEATETLVLRHESLANIDYAELSSAASVELRSRVDRIFMRIVGASYQIFWCSDEAQIGFRGDSKGTPLRFASSGEQEAFVYAVELARLSITANEKTVLGVYGVLNRLSLVWYLGALDVLREFSMTTGASVRLQTPKSDRLSLARKKFEKVAEIVEPENRSF